MKNFWLVMTVLTTSIIVHTHGQKCEDVSVPFCSNLASFHTNTFQPNKHNISNGQDSIQNILSQFSTLFECSLEMRYFLCSTLLPVCENSQPIYPCKSLCLRAVNSERCQSELRMIQTREEVILHPIFNCDNLYEVNSSTCTDFLADNNSLPTNTSTNEPSKPQNITPCESDIFYSSNAKRFATIWFTFWTVMTTLILSFTMLTILLNLSSYTYPSRPILYIILSHMIYCSGIILRAVIGYSSSSCQNGVLIRGEFWNIQHTPCVLIFMTTYFGTISGLVWWIILACCWLLSTLLQRSDGDIGKFKVIFHIIGWTIPTMQTLILISLRESQADELTGICSINVNSHSAYLTGVIVPTFLYAVVGTLGFIASILGILRTYHRMGYYQKHLEKRKIVSMVIRNTSYVVLNSVAIAFFITSQLYEYISQPYNDELSCRGDNCRFASPVIGIIRITSILASACTSTVWIFRPSSYKRWIEIAKRYRKKDIKNTTVLTERDIMRNESFYDIGHITNLHLKMPGFVEINSRSSSENGEIYNTYENSSQYSKPSQQPTIVKWDIAQTTESTCSTTHKSISTV